VEGGLIKDVWSDGARGHHEPEGAQILDAHGKFILPGLIDSHVHYREYMGELFLSHGVTTVVDLGNPYHWQRAVKEALNSDRVHGPRYFFCGGPNLSPSAETDLPTISRRNEVFGTMQRPEDAAAIVKAVAARADCLKLSEEFTAEQFVPLARHAKAGGLAVISHSLHGVDSATWGITGIEHMVGVAIATIRAPAGREALAGLRIAAGHKNSLLYQWMEPEHFDEVIAHLVDRGVYINPTLAFEWKAISDRAARHEAEDLRLLNRGDLQHVPLDERLLTLGQYHWADARSRADREQFETGYRKVQEFLRRFVQAGGKIYAGTDSAAATTPGLSLHHEMELLVDAGLSPMHAIQAATRNGAELIGPGSRVGTVEAGKWADLVVLREDPLADIRNSQTVDTVVKAGRIVDVAYDPSHAMSIPHPGPISKHLYNPLPHLGDIRPPVAQRAESVTLHLVGRGFVANSVATFDGTALPTTVLSPTELEVHVPATLVAQLGVFWISVRNQRPGGGDSSAIPFIVMERAADP
jgi:imidazolonepropionase-like amidohydrolase